MFKLKRILFLLIALLLIVGNIAAQDDMPESIEVVLEGMYPEGIAYDEATGRFFLSSLTTGNVYVSDSEGNIELFAEDEAMVSTLGMLVDAERERLLVAVADPGAGEKTSEDTVGQTALLAVFNLADGELIEIVDLGALLPEQAHVANDLTVDAEGNVYVTDSFAPVIYRVDENYEASVLLEDEAFAAEGFNLNGIIYHPDAYLIASRSNTGELYKVPIDDPEAFAAIELDAVLPGADGMVLLDDTQIAVITNELGAGVPDSNRVTILETSDDWGSAETISSILLDSDPTTGVLVDGSLYILLGHIDNLFNPDADTVIDTFSIQRVNLEEE